VKTDRRYFQFSLCALHFGTSVPERLDHIISFCCVQQGIRRWATLSDEERRRFRSVTESPFLFIPGINVELQAEVQAALGAEKLILKIQSLPSMLDQHSKLHSFISSFETRHGRDAQVRIVTDWVFEARLGKGISFIELAVLSAIYSKIGAKRGAVLIRRDEIWRRAHGCKSKAVFATLSKSLPFPLGESQVRSAVERLHTRGFFSRVTFGRRYTYYSHRLTASELEESVFKRKTQPVTAKRRQQEANDSLTARVKLARSKLAIGLPL
jgi:hypothetical protein